MEGCSACSRHNMQVAMNDTGFQMTCDASYYGNFRRLLQCRYQDSFCIDENAFASDHPPHNRYTDPG
jgi:hypothetical protein